MQFVQLKRREFISVLGGAVVTLPFPARAAAGDAGDRAPQPRIA
jgi:hypothetical protein